MATKNFIWFLPNPANSLDIWAIENALESTMNKDRYGKDENGRFYFLEDNENLWRLQMDRIKSYYDYFKQNKLLVSFTSKEKMNKAMEFLDYKLIPYNQTKKSLELIVHCISFQQKELIRELKKHVRAYVPGHVTI